MLSVRSAESASNIPSAALPASRLPSRMTAGPSFGRHSTSSGQSAARVASGGAGGGFWQRRQPARGSIRRPTRRGAAPPPRARHGRQTAGAAAAAHRPPAGVRRAATPGSRAETGRASLVTGPPPRDGYIRYKPSDQHRTQRRGRPPAPGDDTSNIASHDGR